MSNETRAQLSCAENGTEDMNRWVKATKSRSRRALAAATGFALAFGGIPGAGILATAEPNHPSPIKRAPPDYPRGALSRGIEGFVLLEFVVDAKGNVVAPHVVEGSPPGVFDAAALAAVTRWKYEATGTDNQPIQIRLDFKVAG